ncbi:TBC1 domain family member 3B [Plecturocebus cupreus]
MGPALRSRRISPGLQPGSSPARPPTEPPEDEPDSDSCESRTAKPPLRGPGPLRAQCALRALRTSPDSSPDPDPRADYTCVLSVRPQGPHRAPEDCRDPGRWGPARKGLHGLTGDADHICFPFSQTRARVLRTQAHAGFTWQEDPLQGGQSAPSWPSNPVPAAHLVSSPTMGASSFHTLSWGAVCENIYSGGTQGVPSPALAQGGPRHSWRFIAWSSMPRLPTHLDVGDPWFPHCHFEKSCWVRVPSECVFYSPGITRQEQLAPRTEHLPGSKPRARLEHVGPEPKKIPRKQKPAKKIMRNGERCSP